ncbi:MAG: MFS transporter [Oscillospiraceae bacterium]|nr:MFS transporter [Oscillospiraceae bacterium]
MSDKIMDRARAVRLLSVFCPLLYFASYITRKGYGVVMSEVILSEGITNAAGSLASTLLLISYGVGQILSGVLGDKLRPQNVITAGLGLSSLLNLLMPLCPGPYLRAAVWCLNGLAQSMIWPPLVRIMAECFEPKRFNDVCVNVSIAATGGTVFVYLTSSLLWIPLLSWRWTFVTSAILCAAVTVLWAVSARRIFRVDFSRPAPAPEGAAAPAAPRIRERLSGKLLAASGFAAVALAIVLQGALRDGITDWTPSMVINIFSVSSDSAILGTVAVPVLTAVSLKLVGAVNRRFVKNEVTAGMVTFALSLAGCAALALFYDADRYVTLALAALTCCAVNASNFFLVCITPTRFERYGLVSTMTGVINSFAYVGSASATYGFGALADRAGWHVCMLLWCALAAAGTVLCLAAIRPWRRFFSRT